MCEHAMCDECSEKRPEYIAAMALLMRGSRDI